MEEERRKLLQTTEEARDSFSDMPEEEVEELVADELGKVSSTERKAPSARSGTG
jgi:DNA-binding MarR family transcriptional regulator